MNVHKIHNNEKTIQLQKRLQKQGGEALMQCGPLVISKRGPVDIYITEDSGRLRMEASPRSISDKDLSVFLWRCHNGDMTLAVNSAGRLTGTIYGDDKAILKALGQFPA